MIQQSDENPNRKPIMRFFDKPIVIPDDNEKDESSKETLNSSLKHLSSMKLTDDQAKHLIECLRILRYHEIISKFDKL